ncbi:LOW QUALITY PROTEIN: VQ motif-containing protein 31-like [Phalaenopsis equestris]|uniref:LOW QUALITY PROTEIN: VQ motif-containing protein 31-like n=1 Tax=Phalaenopsis equestris TaxID=78828 RepID=UPI0009E3C91F|nr:LOW QUALITY PROTEIN: VQ motif-containing protein 31-like [Phalaenopsis equestris]
METPTPPTSSGDPTSTPPPHPTTYVQADAATFKELVQRLTGPHDDPSSSSPIPKLSGVRRPAFKLHERRQAYRSKFAVLKPLISPRPPAADLGFSSPGRVSPLVSPSTQLSVLSISEGCVLPPPPVEADNGGGRAATATTTPELNEEEEEKAIRERRFYLHPSPRSGLRSAEPELLALFPLTSPRAE